MPASLPTPCVLGGPWAWHPSRSCAISPPSRVLRHPHQGCSLRCGQLPSQGGPRTGPCPSLPLISQLEEMYIALCPLVPPFSSVWGLLPACLPACHGFLWAHSAYLKPAQHTLVLCVPWHTKPLCGLS